MASVKPKAAEPHPEVPVAAGPFSDWLQATRRARALPVANVPVPCGACNACCRSSMFIHVQPHETQALARIPRRLLFPAPGLPSGHLLMGYDESGRCPMLQGDACSIYPDRPQTCRDFDCRVYAAAGLSPASDGPQSAIAARVRAWRFEHPTPRDAREHDAVRAAAAFLRDHHAELSRSLELPDGPLPLALLAVRVYRVFLELQAAAGDAPQPEAPGEIARRVLAEMGLG